jgi:hypothetical protein
VKDSLIKSKINRRDTTGRRPSQSDLAERSLPVNPKCLFS